MSPTDAFVLSRVDGSLTADEIALLTPFPEEVTRRSLERLLQAGAIAPRPQPATRAAAQVLATLASLKGKNHYAVLGVPSTASHEQITAAYFGLIRRYHPSAFHGPNDPEVLSAARAILARVTKAYEVVGRRESRACFDGPAATAARVD